jgi:hypothetical protein
VWEGAGGLHPAHSSVESTGSAQLISALGWTHTGGLAVSPVALWATHKEFPADSVHGQLRALVLSGDAPTVSI